MTDFYTRKGKATPITPRKVVRYSTGSNTVAPVKAGTIDYVIRNCIVADEEERRMGDDPGEFIRELRKEGVTEEDLAELRELFTAEDIDTESIVGILQKYESQYAKDLRTRNFDEYDDWAVSGAAESYSGWYPRKLPPLRPDQMYTQEGYKYWIVPKIGFDTTSKPALHVMCAKCGDLGTFDDRESDQMLQASKLRESHIESHKKEPISLND